jgi:hypothetical protein
LTDDTQLTDDTEEPMDRMRTILTLLLAELLARLGARLGPVDERGGGRNTDEGFHIAGGAIVAGAIATGVGAFIAKKLGALE